MNDAHLHCASENPAGGSDSEIGCADHFAEVVGSLVRADAALGALVGEVTLLIKSDPSPSHVTWFEHTLNRISGWITSITPAAREGSFFDPTSDEPDLVHIAFRANNLQAWVRGRLANETRLSSLGVA